MEGSEEAHRLRQRDNQPMMNGNHAYVPLLIIIQRFVPIPAVYDDRHIEQILMGLFRLH